MSSILVTITPDEYHAENVGRTLDGRQFFLTTPFVAASREESGREFAALYIFDAAGALVSSQIEDLGLNCHAAAESAKAYPTKFLSLLGKISIETIKIQPFQVEQFGLVFGLILRPGETDDDPWWAHFEPGNYMAFPEPFDSGEYDT